MILKFRMSFIGKRKSSSVLLKTPLRRGIGLGGALVAAALVSQCAMAWSQRVELPDHPYAQPAVGQQTAGSAAAGAVHGVVINDAGAVLEGAQVSLIEISAEDTAGATPARTALTGSNGEFAFSSLPAGRFKLTVTSNGFTTQTVTGTLQDGEDYDAKAIVLRMIGTSSRVEVTASPEEIAQAELNVEETQRVFGAIPNFYVTYVPNAPPLTTRQKYSLAWKSSVDPVTFLTVGVVAGVEQATNGFSGYGQGAQGFGKRYGAGFADSFIGTMIGGAVLPAWWKQDPRYFYKGTGSVRSRALYAIAFSVRCKGDNGHWQVAYAGILGGLAAGGISNLYYPASSRNGVGLTFENALISTGASAISNLFQEFLVRKLTPHVPNYGAAQPQRHRPPKLCLARSDIRFDTKPRIALACQVCQLQGHRFKLRMALRKIKPLTQHLMRDQLWKLPQDGSVMFA